MPPFFENLGKRLVKSPRLYFVDSGLACHLLGIESARALESSPFLGALFEGFVAAEIVKQRLGHGRRREIDCFRDQQGREVDFLVPGRPGEVLLVEAKATRTPLPAMAGPITRLAPAAKRYRTRGVVVHRGSSGGSRVLAPGVEALSLDELLVDLGR